MLRCVGYVEYYQKKILFHFYLREVVYTMDELIFWIYILAIIAGSLFFGMSIYLVNLKIKSGISLVKLKCIGTISLFTTCGISFTTCILIIWGKSEISNGMLVMSFVLFISSIYFFIQGVVQRNSISEKGIVIFTPFPYLLKWEKIQDFHISKKQIFFKKNTGYISVDILNRNIKTLDIVISSKVHNKN